VCWQLGSLLSSIGIRFKSLRVRVRVEGVHRADPELAVRTLLFEQLASFIIIIIIIIIISMR